MSTQGRKRRFFSASLAMVVWLCLGLMLPIIASLYSSNHAFHDAVVAAPRDTSAISRAVPLLGMPNINVERGTIVVVDATGKPTTLTSSAGQPPANPSSLLLENAVIMISRSAVDRGAATDIVDVVAPLVAALSAAKYETLFLRRTTILLSMSDHVAEPISDVQADVSLKRKGTVTVKGSGLVRGQRVSFDLAANGLPVDRQGPGPRIPVKLSVKAPLLEAHFDGRMTTESGLDLQGQGEITLSSVRQFARWFGAAWSPGAGLRDASARGQVALVGETLAIEQAQFRMDGNEAKGALAISFSGIRPQLTGTLAYKSFDAMHYLKGGSGEDREPVTISSIASRLLTAPLGMNLDADLRVSADRMQFGNVEIGHSAATIALKDGRLLADIAELRFNGGEGSGQIGADFTGYYPKLTFRAKLDNVDLGRLSKAVGEHVIVQSAATLVADLTATGGTPRDVLSSLAGKVVIRSTEGGRLGLDLKQLSSGAQDSVAYGWGAAIKGRTPFELLDLKLVLRDGVVLTESAELATSDGVWNATGLVNLVGGRLDVRLTQAMPAPGQLKALAGSRRPAVVELRGPWSEPQIKTVIDPGNAVLPAEPASGGPLPVVRPNRG